MATGGTGARVQVLACPVAGGTVAMLAHELVILPVLVLVLFAAVEEAVTVVAAQQILHFLTVLPV